MKVEWVKQEDAHGCGLAVAAMLTGQTYQAVRNEFAELMDRTPVSFAEKGINHMHIDAYLSKHRFASIRHGMFDVFTNKERTEWPIIVSDWSYCEVEQLATGNWHFVVLLRDGTIIDPLMPETRKPSDYKRIASITGVFKI